MLLGQIPDADDKVPSIDINNRKMATQAVDHLVATGRRNIMMLIPEKLQHIHCIRDRYQGYLDAIEKNELRRSDDFVHTVRSLKENMDSFFAELSCLDEIDAIFCPTDELAALCIEPLKSLGKSIPEDIALMGFDDLPFAKHTHPPLSTVRRPADKQAYAAIDLLLKILNKEAPYEPGFHEIGTELVIREST